MSEGVEAIYLKQVLQVSKYTVTSHTMVKKSLLLEDLWINLLLPSTDLYNTVVGER
jgi:hypothetical protein